MTPGSIYRNGTVFYTYNEDGTEQVIPSDHEHQWEPTVPPAERICTRCTMPATQSV